MEDEKRIRETIITEPAAPVRGENIAVRREPDYVGAYREPAAVKRVSWGAIFAGVVITLVTQILLSILGIGVGASTINPMTEQNSTSGVGTGAGIWFVISLLISLFAGGWVAGRLAGIPRTTDGLLHGLLTWGLATLVLFYLLTSAIGSLIGGTFRVLGSGLSAVGSAAAASAPTIAGAAQNQLKDSGVDVSSIRREAETLLRQTGKPELQPNAIANQAQTATNQAQNTASNVAGNPAGADNEISAIFDRIQKSGSKTIDAADRDALVNVIMARTGKTRPEAEQTVNSYEQTYQKAYQQYEQTKAQVEQKTREVGQATAEGVTKAALWGFVALLLSAAAAAIGSYLATPRDIPARREAAL